MRLSLVFTHCLEKVFHRHSVPPISVEERLSGLNNEVLSWQAVYCLQTPGNETRHELCYQLDGPLAEYISVRQVQSVPSGFPCYRETDENYLTTEPGLFPDPLMPLPQRRFRRRPLLWQPVADPDATGRRATGRRLSVDPAAAGCPERRGAGRGQADAASGAGGVAAANAVAHRVAAHRLPGGLLPSGGVQPGLLARSAPLCALRGACRG